MSTVQNLNLNTRIRRQDRKSVVRELRAVRGPNGPIAWMLAALLDKFRKLPTLTGAEKDATFTRCLKEARQKNIL
jgi:hypothetical protein